LDTIHAPGHQRFKWEYRFPTGFGIPSPPTVREGIVYVSKEKSLYAINEVAGTLKWKTDFTEDIDNCNPVVVNGSLYMRTAAKLVALNAETGNVKWTNGSLHIGGKRSSFPINNNVLYMPCDSFSFVTNQICCFNAVTGDVIWKSLSPGAGSTGTSSPIVAHGNVYCGSTDGNLYVWDKLTGGIKWKYQTADEIRTGGTIVNDIIYFGSGDKYMYALNALTGDLKWKFLTGDRINYASAIVTGKEGRVYYPSNSGNVD
jgi:outer membrane protein assembly factor BamB